MKYCMLHLTPVFRETLFHCVIASESHSRSSKYETARTKMIIRGGLRCGLIGQVRMRGLVGVIGLSDTVQLRELVEEKPLLCYSCSSESSAFPREVVSPCSF